MKFTSVSLENISHVAEQILKKIPLPYWFFLEGDLGVGKTALVQKFLSYMGVEDKVSSPTYNYLSQYTNNKNQKFFHFDLYRLSEGRESENFLSQYSEYFNQAFVCIEWSERLSDDYKKLFYQKGFKRILIKENDKDLRTIEVL